MSRDQYEALSGEQLDEMVTDAKCGEAAAINNEGRESLDESQPPEITLNLITLSLTPNQYEALGWLFDTARDRVATNTYATSYESEDGRELYRDRARLCRLVAAFTPFPGDAESWLEQADKYKAFSKGRRKA